MKSLPPGFLLGAFVTFVILIFVAFIKNIIDDARRKVRAFDEPMEIKLYTKRTPADVELVANAARWRLRILTAWLFGGGGLLLYTMSKSPHDSLFALLVDLILTSFNLVIWAVQTLHRILSL